MTGILGVIGGSGLYAMPGLSNVEQVNVDTPFGAPSDALVRGDLDGRTVVFLPRHGVGHRLLPSEVPYLANIWALKKLGVTQVLSVSAVGSLREDVHPGHVVVVDQFLDRTRLRRSTFFGGGVVGHVGFGDPVCGALHGVLLQAAQASDATVHPKGTYCCMEGPQFSTRAESFLHRRDGADVIGMTNMPEAKLAREAELCYASLALVTDHDCWHISDAPVTVDAVMAVVRSNVALAQRVIRHVSQGLASKKACGCGSAAQGAIMTDLARIPAEKKAELQLLFGRYWN